MWVIQYTRQIVWCHKWGLLLAHSNSKASINAILQTIPVRDAVITLPGVGFILWEWHALDSCNKMFLNCRVWGYVYNMPRHWPLRLKWHPQPDVQLCLMDSRWPSIHMHKQQKVFLGRDTCLKVKILRQPLCWLPSTGGAPWRNNWPYQHLDITWTNTHVPHAHNSLQGEPGLTASTQSKAATGAVALLKLRLTQQLVIAT